MASETCPSSETPSLFMFDMPDPPVLPTAAQLVEKLEQSWQIIQTTSLDPVFACTHTDPFGNEDLMESLCMNAGSKAFEDICAHWRCEDDPDFKPAKFLYGKLKSFLTTACGAMLPEVAKKRKGEKLAKAAFENTKRFWNITSYLEAYFTYLDWGYSIKFGVRRVRDMARDCYITTVYDNTSLRLREFAFECLTAYRILQDRRSKVLLINHKTLIDYLADKDEEFIEREWNSPLRANCHKLLRRKEARDKKHCICYFVKHASKRMYEIRSFSAGKKNPFTFRNEIFQKTEEFFFPNNGNPVIHLVEKECHRSLVRMCQVYGKDQEFMKRVANIFKKHLSETVIVNFKKSVAENPEPSDYFKQFIGAWSKTAMLAKKSLSGKGHERYIVEALTDPFVPLISESEQLLHNQIEQYFDKFLRKDDRKKLLKGKTLSQEVEVVVILLGNLPNFEALVNRYRSKLAKRLSCQEFSQKRAVLFLKPFTDNFLELDVVAKLKGLMSVVTKQEENSLAFTPKFDKRFMLFLPDVMGIKRCMVVQKVDWPEELSVEMRLPVTMTQATKLYNSYFKKNHSEKEFVYNFSSDRVTVSTNMFAPGARKIKLHMTTHQLCILDLFQEEDSLTVSQVLEGVKSGNGVDRGEEKDLEDKSFLEKLFQYLRSMMTEGCPLLKKTPDSPTFQMEDLVSLNKGFTAARRRLVLPVP